MTQLLEANFSTDQHSTERSVSWSSFSPHAHGPHTHLTVVPYDDSVVVDNE